MVEKIIDIPETQDEELKSLAEILNLSEEELICMALGAFLKSHKQIPRPPSGVDPLEDFIALALETSKKHRLPEGYRFNRDELYGEYNARLPEDALPKKNHQTAS